MNSDLSVQNPNPLVDPPPVEVKLSRAPLALVVTQLRFAPIPKMEDRSYIAAFQELVRSDYPFLEEEKISFALNIGMPLPPNAGPSRTLWKMKSLDGQWRLILSADFVALETNAYDSREGFLEKWDRILDAFKASFQNVVALRYGLRYLNRVSDPSLLNRLPDLVRKDALGILPALPSPTAMITEAVYPFAEGSLLARWGCLPPLATHDPTIPAVSTASWVLDYDLFKDSIPTATPISLDSIGGLARAYSQRGYAFFRWMVQDAFLKAHGAAA